MYDQAPNWLLRTSTCFTLSFAFVQTFMTFFISLNRMTVFLQPVYHTLIWKCAFPISVAVTLISPFFFTYSMFLASTSIVVDDVTRTYAILSNADVGSILGQLLIFMSVFLFASSIVNATSVVLLCKRPKHHHDRAEWKMLLIALLNFLVDLGFFTMFDFETGMRTQLIVASKSSALLDRSV